MIVTDASAVVMLLADAGPVGAGLRARVTRERLYAPHLIDIEVTSALLGRHRGGKLTSAELDDAWGSFARLPVHRTAYTPFLARIRELHADVSPYDAAYVALAEAFGFPLITSDSRIARSGRARCPVEVFNEASIRRS